MAILANLAPDLIAGLRHPEPATPIFASRLLTPDDVAALLGVPRSMVYTLARRGDLPTVRVGDRYVRFRAEAVDQWIARCETTEPRGTQ
jgi:excisionase family DNA binding protein